MIRLNDLDQLERQSSLRASRVRPRTSIVRGQADILALMRLLTAVAAATLTLALSTHGATPATPIAPRRSSSSFDFSYVVRVTPSPSTHNVRVWVPVPSSDEFQTISQVRLEAPVKVQMRKEVKYGDHYAYFTVHSSRTQSPFEIRLTFHVVRYERRLDLASAIDPAGPFPKDVAAFLQPDKLAPFDGVIASVAREQTRGLASPLEKARHIYEYVLSTMRYDHEGASAGCGDALWAFQSHRGNCTDFHSLFIGMARAAGIPARFEIGFVVPEGQKEGTVTGYHSWAEFFVNGIGWIPVDASQASQDPSQQDHFCGTIDARRVMVSMGRDISVMPAPQTGPFNYLVYPYIEMDVEPSPNYSIDFFFNEAQFISTPPSLIRKSIFAGGQWMTVGRSLRFPS
jgi:transglutaminase-like putative cysteine protease